MTGDHTHNHYKENSSWTETCHFSTHREDGSHLMVITDCESKKPLDTQTPRTVKGCWAASWMAPDLSLDPSCQWGAGKWPVLVLISTAFFFPLPPAPFVPFLSPLALEHWCKNFKPHQPWCNSIWFTGSWRLFLASRHAEWQMLWRSCSCPDKSQVKIKVAETFRHKSKSRGRKNLESSPWI